MKINKKEEFSQEYLEKVAAAGGATVSAVEKLIVGEDSDTNDKKDVIRIQNKINEAFSKFISEEIPKEVSLHELTESSIIIRIFDYEPPRESSIFVTGTRRAGTIPYMTFAIAKVLSSGPKSIYKPGDIVKLRDFEARTLKNPKYEMWDNNPYSKSNLKKVGEAPPEYTSAAMAVYGPRMFMLNPLSFEIKPQDWITFKISDQNVENKIKNPEDLLSINK